MGVVMDTYVIYSRLFSEPAKKARQVAIVFGSDFKKY